MRTIKRDISSILSMPDQSRPDFSLNTVPERGMIIQNITLLIEPEVLSKRCVSNSCFGLDDRQIAETVSSALLEMSQSLRDGESLVVDFAHATTSASFLFTFLQRLYFPKSLDVSVTDRPIKQKKVVLANPDESTLLSIAQCLELAYTQCMVVQSTTETPWKLLYVGHMEQRLEDTLRSVNNQPAVTVKSLVTDEFSKNRAVPTSEQEVRGINRINFSLKELYHLGLINREKLPVTNKSKPCYQYSLYHPFQHHVRNYRPVELQFYKMPRPPRTRKASVPTSKNPAEDPEPVQYLLSNWAEQYEINLCLVAHQYQWVMSGIYWPSCLHRQSNGAKP